MKSGKLVEIVKKIRGVVTLRNILHSWGIAWLCSAVFLQLLVFKDILFQGYFLGVEPRPLILAVEMLGAFSGIVYMAFVYHQVISRLRKA